MGNDGVSLSPQADKADRSEVFHIFVDGRWQFSCQKGGVLHMAERPLGSNNVFGIQKEQLDLPHKASGTWPIVTVKAEHCC